MTSRRKLALTAFVATLVASLVSVGTSASFNGQGRNPTGVVSTDALDAPTGLIASGGSTASLSWTATPDTYASGYRIFRGTASGGPYTQIDQVTPRTNTTFVDSPGNGTYYYVVRAFYQSWESVNSNQASATVAVGIAYDSSSSTTGTGGSLTWSHTVGSDSNRVLVVGVSIRKSAKTVTNVTYGGVGGFTQAGTQTFDGSDHRVEIWYQLMPAVGTANVVVTLSAAEDAVAGAVSYGGVHQTTPLGTFTGAGGNNQAPTVDIASRADEVVLGLVSISGDHNGMTLGGGQTQRWTGSTGTGDGAEFGAGSTEPGADSVTMSWSAVNSNRWAIGAVAVKPATVVSPAAPSGLGATGLSSSEISLSWTDNSTNEDGFKIERSPAGQGSWSEVATVGAGTTTYLDAGLTASTAFDYRVRAHNAGGNSPYSNVASATTASGAGGVAVDNTSSTTGTGSSLTWSHTVGSGSNRVLIVGVSIRKSAKTVTNVTYGGVGGFTQAGTQTFDGTDHRVEIWYQLMPTVGTANVVVTLSGGEDAVAGAVSFTGVHQTTPLGTFTGAGGNNQTPTVDVASDGDELVLAVVSISGDHNGMTLGGGQTERWSGSNGTSDGSEFGAASTEPGQATVTMSWSAVNANKWAIAGVSLKPVNTSAPAAPSSLSATPVSSRIDLAWTDGSSNESGFKIERSPAGAGTWAEMASVGASVTAYQDTGLPQTTSYDYRVRAYNGAGNSSYSNVASATTLDLFPNAVDVQASNGGATVGRPELGDTITYTFSETMSANSILSGWDGSSTSVVVQITNSGSSDDTVTIWNAANTTQLNLGSVDANGDIVTATATFGASGTASTMVRSGSVITVTLGTLNSGGVRTGSSVAMVWSPSTSATDMTGNACQGTPATESGAADLDF